MRKIAIGVALLLLGLYGAWQLSRARTFQLFGEIVPRVETDRKVVALTFDDGPRSDTVDEILGTLAKHGVRATFFVCGAEIHDHPQAAAQGGERSLAALVGARERRLDGGGHAATSACE